MNLEELTFVSGGEVRKDVLPESITLERYCHYLGWLDSLREYWLDPFVEGADCPHIFIVTSRSPSMACRIRLLDDGSAGLVVPLGVLARTTALARLLLRSFESTEPTIQVVASVLDDYTESDWGIAPRLEPVFGELADHDAHWSQLASLVTSSPLPPELEPAIDDIAWPCIVYLIWHEVAHVARGHFALLTHARARADDDLHDAVMRALELDADCLAAKLLVFTALGRLESADQETLDSAFHWIGYAVAMVFGLYDARRKALGLYSRSDHPHPIIRRQLFSDAAAAYVSEDRLDLADAWRTHERAGWSACVEALRRLDVEALRGRFGGTAGTTHRFAPVTALTYTAFDATVVRERADAEIAGAERTFGLIGYAT